MVMAKRYNPEAVVSFSTETGELTMRLKTEKEGTAIDNSVLSIHTSNDLSSDAATFQIELAPNKPWETILASNDLVWIKMSRAGKTKEFPDPVTVFVGLIDDVRKSVTVQGETPQRTITVTGRSFAKALINFEIGTVSEMNLSLNAGWLLNSGITFAQQQASQIVSDILNELVFKFMNYTFNNGATLKSLMAAYLSSRPGERLFDQTSFVNFQGSIWSFIREIVNEPFNQVFWECYDNHPTMVVRETPFNPDQWNDLQLYEITDEDVVLDNIGRSDIETYSLYSVGMQSFFSSFDISKTVNVFPYWYEPYFKKFGLRRLQRYTNYVGFASTGGASGDESDKLRAYQKDLYNWNIMNPSFLNGYITVIGDERYKVGERLLYKSKESGREIEFFIEGVAHDFINYGYWVTRLSVTRGLDDAGAKRFDEPWDSYTTYDPTALGLPGIPSAADAGGASNTGSPMFPLPSFGNSSFPPADGVINFAKTFIGKVQYKLGWGRNTKDIAFNRFDCSSWIRYVFAQNNINLGPMESITTDTIAKQGMEISSSQLRPGDLVFFNTYKRNGHVTLYIGNGEVIQCGTSGVKITSMNYWMNNYTMGSIRRVFLV